MKSFFFSFFLETEHGFWTMVLNVGWTLQSLESGSRSVMSDSLQLCGYSPWNSPGQNTGVGSCSLLQGISPTQGLNPGLPHCRWVLYQLSHQGSPRILEWVAYPFSIGSSPPRNWTGSPSLQVNSLPTELLGKPHRHKGHNIIPLLLVQAADT